MRRFDWKAEMVELRWRRVVDQKRSPDFSVLVEFSEKQAMGGGLSGAE